MRLRNFSMLGNVATALALALLCCLLLAGCAMPPRVITITRAEAVPYPARPAFTALQNGDVACMSFSARQRLGQRHIEVVWYLRELENTLKTYDAQTRIPEKTAGKATRMAPRQSEASHASHD